MSTPPPARLAHILPILVVASAASIMSTDLYTPSLPSLTEVFGTTARAVQLTLTLNLAVFGIAQLWLGPLSDRYGRRPVLIAGLVGFVLASVACALAQSIEQLIAARIVQGFCGAVEAVVGLAVVRDLFAGPERVRAYAIWGIALALVPGAAPILGGYVHVAFGWRANFVLVALSGLVAVWLVWRALPESTVPSPGAAGLGRMLRDYRRLAGDRLFVRHVLVLGCAMGVIYGFITVGPFLIIERYGVAVERFGYCQAAIVVAYLIGSVATDRLVRRVGQRRLLAAGAACAAVGACLLPVLMRPGLEGPVTLSAAMSVVALGLGPIFAIVPAEALDVAPSSPGAASAGIGAMQMGIGAAAAGTINALHDGTPQPLVITVTGLLVIGTLAWWRGAGPRR